MSIATPLHAQIEAKLMRRVGRPSPEFARALALAGVRETFEETGLSHGATQAPAEQLQSRHGHAVGASGDGRLVGEDHSDEEAHAERGDG